MSKHLGSSFESFLDEVGQREEVDALTLKKVLADDLRRLAKAKHLTTAQLAERMGTSRMSVHRLFDATEPGFTGETLARVANALGVAVRIVFGEEEPAPMKRRVRASRPR